MLRRARPWLAPLILIVGAAVACSSSSDGDGGGDGDGSSGGPGGGPDGSTINAGDGQASSSSGSSGTSGDSGPGTPVSLAKHKAEMLTSLWENSTMIIQYEFSRNNHDGYGYTSGRAGFTTATTDSASVVDCFDKAFGTGGGNKMAKYQAALDALAKKEQNGNLDGDTSTLDAIGDYNADWTATANDGTTAPDFDGCQDQIVDQLYWQPALDVQQKWGVMSNLSMASLYDAMIVHGLDNVNTLAKQANNDTGNTAQKPATAALSTADEDLWLQAFLKHRVVLVAGNSAWSGAIDRVATYESLRQMANWDLSAQIVTDAKAKVVFGNNSYKDGGYPACIIAPDGDVSGPADCTAPVSN